MIHAILLALGLVSAAPPTLGPAAPEFNEARDERPYVVLQGPYVTGNALQAALDAMAENPGGGVVIIRGVRRIELNHPIEIPANTSLFGGGVVLEASNALCSVYRAQGVTGLILGCDDQQPPAAPASDATVRPHG